MNERLKEIRHHLNMNQNDLGSRIKLSRSHISSLENGAREITDRIIYDICRELNVNEQWLRTGEGGMFSETEHFSLDEKAEKFNLTDLEIEIMKNYMELDDNVRKSIVGMFKKSFNEVAAATEEGLDIDKEVENYRQELAASKKAKKLSASDISSEGETS